MTAMNEFRFGVFPENNYKRLARNRIENIHFA